MRPLSEGEWRLLFWVGVAIVIVLFATGTCSFPAPSQNDREDLIEYPDTCYGRIGPYEC